MEVNKHLNIKDMEWILTIAEEKNMTRAAERLYITQPALSQCLRKVENELETRLLQRTSSGMEWTKAGRIFEEMARKVTSEYGRFEQRIIEIKTAVQTHLTLGIPPRQSTRYSALVLAEMKRLYPDINFKILEIGSDLLEQALLRGEADIGLMTLPVLSEGLSSYIYGEGRRCIFLRKGSSLGKDAFPDPKTGMRYLDIKRLKEEPIALTFHGKRSRIATDRIFQLAGIKPNIVHESSSTDTLYSLAKQGIASTILSPINFTPQDLQQVYEIEDKYEPTIKFGIVVADTQKQAYSCFVKSLLSILQQRLKSAQ